MNIAIMVRRTVARTVCGSATRWNRGATVTGPVEHAWWPSPSPQPPSSPALRERKGGLYPRTFHRPLSVPTKRAEEQGCERSRGDPASASCNDTESTNQFTPLPQRRSGVGGEGGPHLPPQPPFLSHAAGAGLGVRAALTFPPNPPFLSHAAGEEGGGIMPHTFPRPPAASTKGVAGESVAVAILRQHLSTIPSPLTNTPLSRAAGEGPGVRAARSAGAESGVRAARTFPRPLSVPTKRAEEQGGERSRSDPVPASVNDTETTTTPLPQCGRGAGGEGRPQRGSGIGGEGRPPGRENVRRMAEQNVGPATQWLLEFGTFPMKNPSF